MTTKQSIKKSVASGQVAQSSSGGEADVSQDIEDVDSGGSIEQKAESNSLRIGIAQGSGLIAVLILGLIAALYLILK